jgi:hypothetical protein
MATCSLWQGDHRDGVPIFVLTHHVPDNPPPGNGALFARLDGPADCSGVVDGGVRRRCPCQDDDTGHSGGHVIMVTIRGPVPMCCTLAVHVRCTR